MQYSKSYVTTVLRLIIVSALTSTSVSALAQTQKQRCINAAVGAFAIAKARDSGVTSKEMGAMIRHNAVENNLSEEDFTAMYAMAGFVYSDLRNKSPEQIQRSFLAECKAM